MEVSIQGKYHSKVNDLYTRYEFKNGMKYDPLRHQLEVGEFGVGRGISTVELLVDVELLIHIIPQDQTLVKEIQNAFLLPKEYPSLGRREDIVTIMEVKVVDIWEEENLKSSIRAREDYSAYIPINLLDDVKLKNRVQGIDVTGTRYKLTKSYELVNYGTRNSPKIFRNWEKIDVLYGSNISALRKKNITLDEDNNIIFFV